MFNTKLTLALLLIIAFSTFATSYLIKQKKLPKSRTSITARNSTTGKSHIEFGILNKQHHLYIGRCKPNDVKFHGENIILNNSGDNHVTAVISVSIIKFFFFNPSKILVGKC
ncbi:hypothetical protein AMK59_7014 [Oryctes borbonicus]|uniref:Uncharacterized protein n=1 Tax=Oryctes borbonicus TaxID=1629725 RepID=A0A0T6ATP8_9SCAR|nr:hypothetical protein AMK59_7014 [Oryctes borbonicus]